MTDVRIALTGINAQGRHGANPGERDFPQDFVVDLSVLLDVPEDSLESTLDYRIIAQLVRDTVSQRSFVLLESLADAIASAMFEYATVAEATAVVHKPSAAQSLGIQDVSAHVTAK